MVIINALCALLCGFTVGTKLNLSLLLFFLVVEARTSDYKKAFLYAILFYLAASRGLCPGAAVFFGNTPLSRFFGFILWVSASVVLSSVFSAVTAVKSALMRKAEKNNHASCCAQFFVCLLCQFLIFIFITFPPCGLIGWANPFLCAGAIFPACGIYGLGLTIIFSALCGVIPANTRVFYGLTVFSILLVICGSVIFPYLFPVRQPDKFVGINTNFGKLASGDRDNSSAFNRTIALLSLLEAQRDKSKIVVLPETIAGTWTDLTERLFGHETEKYRAAGGGVIIGGEVIKDNALGYFNVLQIRGSTTETIEQKVPVPVSMFKPWDKRSSAHADFLNCNVKRIFGHKAAFLVCYEAFIAYPMLLCAAKRPELIVFSTNLWWCRNTSLPKVCEQYTKTWASMLNIPLVTAKNI